MALPKLPSIQEVLEEPSLILKLPLPLALEMKNRLQHLVSMVEGAHHLPPTPVELAIKYPRYRFLDAPHIHYLGQEVAETIETRSASLICMPPRHCKSSVCSVWTPFWALARDPTLHIIFVSYEAKFAAKWGLRVRNLVETYGKEYGLELAPKSTAAGDWELTTGGGMYSTGVGGGISGRPAGLFIFDDLIKDEEEARSQVVRDATWEWWDMTAMQRIEPDTAVFGVGTRWGEDDIIGRQIAASGRGEGIEFRIVSLPAIAEADDPIGRVEGEGLWLPKFSQEWYEKRRNDVSPYTWSAVYQQRPTPIGGNTVDPSWWRYYRPSELPLEFDQEAQSWDLALDAEKKSDSYHCGIVASRKGALVFLRDAFHEHCPSPQVISQIRDWNVVYPRARTKLVERAIAGPWLIQTLRHEITGLTPWPPKGKRKGSKEANLNAAVPSIRSGNVLLPMNPDGSKPRWVQELIQELAQFPRAPHDDYVDATSQVLNFLLPAARRAVEDDQYQAALHRPHVTPVQHHTDMLHRFVKKLGRHKIDHMKKIQQKYERSGHVLSFDRIPTGSEIGSRRRLTRKIW